jgi:hypothetical protein
MVQSYSEASKFSPRLLFLGILLPTNFYIAKWFLVAANILFTYHIFRLNAVFRAHFGSRQFGRLLNQYQKVEFISSSELQSEIEAACKEATLALDHDHLEKWSWSPGQDLHDDAVALLEKRLKLPELQQTIRRYRMQIMVFEKL